MSWYSKKAQGLHYFRIEYKNLKIYVGGRPCHKGTTRKFARKIDHWIAVHDRLNPEYTRPPWRPLMSWYPLVENDDPGNWGWKVFFWFTKLMDRELSTKGGRRIYIHCDVGSHRSPTLTYMWLRMKLPKQAALKVFENRIRQPDNDYEKLTFSDPEGYLMSHIRDGSLPSLEDMAEVYTGMQESGINHLESILWSLKWKKEKLNSSTMQKGLVSSRRITGTRISSCTSLG